MDWVNLISAARPALPAPVLEYGLLLPMFIVVGGAVLGVVLEAALPRGRRFVPQTAVALLTVAAALVGTVAAYRDLDPIDGRRPARGTIGAEGALALDGPGLFTWGMLLVFALLSFALFADRQLDSGLSSFTGRAADAPGSKSEAEAVRARLEHTEIFPLGMFALVGMMVFATSNDLITMFIALEVLSLPLYVMCGMARRRRLLSQEAALKYFLLGAFSSVFFLYGAALAYGYSGSFRLSEIATAVSARSESPAMLLAAIALVAVGLLFKVGAVPFHSWTPDVYQGAPTPVTAFMAAGTKAAAFIALLRVFYVAFEGASWDWRPMFWIVAIITMFVGSLVAVSQTDAKRMLAYSSIAHAGFILVGFVGLYGGTSDGAAMTSVSSVLVYLTIYGIGSIGAFAVVTLVRDSSGEATHLAKWAGLGRTSPWLAGAFALFMLSFAGIPLTAGFIGKWSVFSAAWAGGMWPLVVVGVLMSAIAAYFYMRVIVLMFFTDPVGEGSSDIATGRLTTVVIAVAAIATVALGVAPGPLIDLAQNAGALVR